MAAPILSTVGIKDDVVFGENVKVVQPVHLYGCSIGDNCFIGPFTEIQNNVSIGENCFIGHVVMFINDPFISGGPARGDKTKWRSTKIGNNVSIGSNAALMPVEICDHVVIGAGAVVNKNIIEPGVYVGNTAR